MFTSSTNASAQALASLANNTFNNSVIQICPLVLDASFQFADIRDLSTIDSLLKHTPWHPCGIWKRGLSIRQCPITSCQRHSSTAGARVARFCPTRTLASSDLNPVDPSVWSVKICDLQHVWRFLRDNNCQSCLSLINDSLKCTCNYCVAGSIWHFEFP